MTRVARIPGSFVERAVAECLPPGCGFLDERLKRLFAIISPGPVVVAPDWIFWPGPATRLDLLSQTTFGARDGRDSYFEVVLGEARGGHAVITFRREDREAGSFRFFDLRRPGNAPLELGRLERVPRRFLDEDSLRTGILRNGVELVSPREVSAAVDRWGARDAKACFEGCAVKSADGRWFAFGAGKQIATTGAGKAFVETSGGLTEASCGRCREKRLLPLSLGDCAADLLRDTWRVGGWTCGCNAPR